MPPDDTPGRARRTRILIVDDDPLFLEVAANVLCKAGYDVVTAADGSTCQAALEANEFNLLILDCGLSNPSELAILDLVQRRAGNCSVMILSSRT